MALRVSQNFSTINKHTCEKCKEILYKDSIASKQKTCEHKKCPCKYRKFRRRMAEFFECLEYDLIPVISGKVEINPTTTVNYQPVMTPSNNCGNRCVYDHMTSCVEPCCRDYSYC